MKHQRYLVHKTANILDNVPSRVQPKAKEKIHDIYLAEMKEQALVSYNAFFTTYVSKFPKARECLSKDKESLFAFYDFPTEHWVHIHTANQIESTFATLQHWTSGTKGCGTRHTTFTMVFKLTKEAEKTQKRITGYSLIPSVLNETKFINGEAQDEKEQVA